MTATTKLALELLQNNAANQVLANTTFAQLNQLVQASVADRINTPPGSPANEALYIITATATGVWAGKENQLAYWLTSTGAWQFIAPREGMLVHVNDEDVYYKYTGSVWEIFAAGMGNSFSGARVSISANKSIPSGILTKVAFDVEDYDDGGYVDLASSTTKITIPITGLYRLSFFSTFASNATGRRVARIQNDAGAVVYARCDMPAVPGGLTTPNGGTDVTLTAGTEINLVVFQDSGGALDLPSNSLERTVFAIQRLK